MTSPKELDEFEFQLRAQKEFGAEQPAPGVNDARTYVDPNDGTVYEWDSEKQGWFPKVVHIIILPLPKLCKHYLSGMTSYSIF